MLKITTDGRKAALDLRLVDPNAMFTYQSKVARCVENVADIYFRTTVQKSVQIIFCDTSTPKTGFNIYDEVKTMLQSKGIPADKIAFIHDAETEAQRNAMFAEVRNGYIRVLLGSTFKLGLGVNIQDKLIAMHHIDVPWRPADMTQREGRILRQGNTNSKVQLSRYLTLQRKLVETRIRMEKELLEMPGKKSNQENNIVGCEADIAYYTGWKQANPAPSDNKVKKDAGGIPVLWLLNNEEVNPPWGKIARISLL